MFNSIKQSQSAFTLIELLVIMSIIGLLSTAVTVGTNSARMNARDARRAQDVNGLQNAFELYYADNGVYPPSRNAIVSGYGVVTSTESNWETYLQPLLSPFTVKLPKDPLNKAPTILEPIGYDYSYLSDPNMDFCVTSDTGVVYLTGGYYIYTRMEKANNLSINDGGASNVYYERYGGNVVVRPLSEPCFIF